MSAIIQVYNLSKSYVITHEGKESYTALRDVMARKAKKIFSFPKLLRPGPTVEKEVFWALKDINFEIEKGDRVGIIGRNGAGKSTLLKILSRITEPTTGQIKIKGRVASLLEVGTGFHPELTGRENIFLNGAILGMSRAEIKKKFDAIVDFAEVEKFLDTPVKRYSSGMYVRLAFAVAAHLEPEILVVDEVLAVGDAQFQKKCLGKMEDVSTNEGRTVIFVSHQMDAIEKLTNHTIMMKSGKLSMFGDTLDVVSAYLRDDSAHEEISQHQSREGNGKVRITKVSVISNGTKVSMLKQGQSFTVEIEFISITNEPFDLSFVLENHKEQALFCTQLSDNAKVISINGNGNLKLVFDIPFIRKGDYRYSMAVFKPDQTEFFDILTHFPLFSIDGTEPGNYFPHNNRWGDFYFNVSWL